MFWCIFCTIIYYCSKETNQVFQRIGAQKTGNIVKIETFELLSQLNSSQSLYSMCVPIHWLGFAHRMKELSTSSRVRKTTINPCKTSLFCLSEPFFEAVFLADFRSPSSVLAFAPIGNCVGSWSPHLSEVRQKNIWSQICLVLFSRHPLLRKGSRISQYSFFQEEKKAFEWSLLLKWSRDHSDRFIKALK